MQARGLHLSRNVIWDISIVIFIYLKIYRIPRMVYYISVNLIASVVFMHDFHVPQVRFIRQI
jgi:hypothetical protein